MKSGLTSLICNCESGVYKTLVRTIFSGVDKNLLGIQNDDILIQIQEIIVTPDNVEDLWEKYFDYNMNAPELYVTVKRNGIEQVLSAKLYKVHYDAINYLDPVKKRTAEQETTLKQLLN